MICGTLSPDERRCENIWSCRGFARIGLSVSIQESTGRENIYLNATVLGLGQQEIEDRLADIIEFADIGQFIDQPVKSYSSGMVVRLAFAVQSQIEPDHTDRR